MTLADLKAKAQALNITQAQVKSIGPLNKRASWQAAIDEAEALAAEAAEESRAAAVDHAYKSPSAPVIIPVAYGAAYLTTLVNGIRGCL